MDPHAYMMNAGASGGRPRRGAALLVVVFLVALLTVMVSGFLHVQTEDIQVMVNQKGLAEARAIAEAALARGYAEKRLDPSWDQGLADLPFAGGRHSLTVDGWTLTATGRSAQGFETRLTAAISVLGTAVPYTVRVDSLRSLP